MDLNGSLGGQNGFYKNTVGRDKEKKRNQPF